MHLSFNLVKSDSVDWRNLEVEEVFTHTEATEFDRSSDIEYEIDTEKKSVSLF